MALRRKRNRFWEWVLSFFNSPKDEICVMPNVPPRQTGSGTFFNNAQGFTMHNPTMMDVQGDQYTTYVQRDPNIAPQIMSLLSKRGIPGAAHDSSARTPPPRCHPGTRVRLLARITAWFEGQGPQELLLWITGPAGVGKSALVQTFAEYLVKYDCLGASVFISRPNKRNNPHGIFITIAYQLATRIGAYRDFIVERLSLDPELLTRDMQTQFATFIVEPFVRMGIGAGAKRWVILLDGLDELDGEDAQRNIIQLISTLVLEHRDTPLLWIIASRPESHISNMFEDDDIRASHWTEYIPIDSSEACEDVDRFLRSGFKKMQKEFRNSVPRDWPSDTDFLKLTAAASGLFIYAQVVTEFIRDSAHADPIRRLDVLLSVIDRSDAIPTTENPFVHLDALYREILCSIPLTLWPTAKRLLALAIFVEHDGFWAVSEYFNTLKGMSILFGIPRHEIYACLNKCRSTVRLPDWKVAHKQKLAFHHASFADYLSDSSRSGEFYVGDLENAEQNDELRVLEIWNECGGDNIDPASVQSTFDEYCSKLDGQTPSGEIAKINAKIFSSMALFVQAQLKETFEALAGLSDTETEPLMLEQLLRVNMMNLFYCLDPADWVYFTSSLRPIFSKFSNTDFFRATELKHLKFGHLNCNEMIPTRANYGRTGMVPMKRWILHRPRTSAELIAFVSELESIQETSPKLEGFIIGGTPKGRVAVFYLKQSPYSLSYTFYVSYVIPYLE